MGFPVAQAVMIALLGWLLGVTFFALACLGINKGLSGGFLIAGDVCRLEFAHHLIAVSASVAVAIVASLIAARRVTAIDPAEGTHLV